MMLIELSEATAARRRVPVVLVDGTDGITAETGVTLSAGDMKISKNGGAEANHAGTLTELAGGDYYYEFAEAELDTVGYITGRIVKAGVRTFRIAAQVVAFDPYAASNLGLTNLDATVSTRATQTSVDTIDDFLDTEVAAIKAKTDNLPADPADASDIAASFATVNGTLATLATDALLTTVAGYLDTEIAAIKAKTDNLPASPAATGAAMALTGAAVDAILDEVVDGAYTMRELLRLFAAALAGKASGLETTTAVFRDISDTKDRITATVDADGNRTALTLDAT